jgi:hypothetical protein
LKKDSEREIALLNQNLEFLTMQFKESQEMLEDAKKTRDAMVKALEGKDDSRCDSSRSRFGGNVRLECMEEQYTQEINDLEDNMAQMKYEYE